MKTKYLDNEIELLNSIKRNHEISDYGEEKLNEFMEIKKQLLLHNVVGQSEQLPTLIEIDFDGHLKCQVETTDIKPKILKAVNGYGQSVDCREGKIKIREV